MSEKMTIKCKDCDLAVTNELTELRNGRKLDNSDEGRTNVIEKGYYFISDKKYSREPKGSIIVNNNDLINSKIHPDFSIGCCGLDGDGMNIACSNGHEVGRQYSECWMPHYTVFEFGLINFDE